MSNQLWPSERMRSGSSGKPNISRQKMRTDWGTGFLTFVFVFILVVGVMWGVYHFVLADFIESLGALNKAFPKMQLVSSRG